MANLAQGTTLKMGTSATAAGTIIGKVTDFSGPSSSRTVIDTTDLSSSDMEFAVGLKDNGEFGFSINYEPGAAHKDLEDAHDSGDLRYFTLTFKSGAAQKFAGYLLTFAPEGAVNSVLTAKLSIKISGAVTRTAATVTP